MKKTIWIITVVVILAVAIFLYGRRQATAPETAGSPTPTPSITQGVPTPTQMPDDKESPSQHREGQPVPTPTPTPNPIPASVNHSVVFGADGSLNQTTLNIKVGDSVTFLNNDSTSHWPASGVHPTHQICPGFDSLRGLGRGETYSFTFNEARTCPFHDHLNPSISGQIIVGQ